MNKPYMVFENVLVGTSRDTKNGHLVAVVWMGGEQPFFDEPELRTLKEGDTVTVHAVPSSNGKFMNDVSLKKHTPAGVEPDVFDGDSAPAKRPRKRSETASV